MLEDTLAFRLFALLLCVSFYFGLGWLVACGLYWEWFVPEVNGRSVFFGTLALLAGVCTAWPQR